MNNAQPSEVINTASLSPQMHGSDLALGREALQGFTTHLHNSQAFRALGRSILVANRAALWPGFEKQISSADMLGEAFALSTWKLLVVLYVGQDWGDWRTRMTKLPWWGGSDHWQPETAPGNSQENNAAWLMERLVWLTYTGTCANTAIFCPYTSVSFVVMTSVWVCSNVDAWLVHSLFNFVLFQSAMKEWKAFDFGASRSHNAYFQQFIEKITPLPSLAHCENIERRVPVYCITRLKRKISLASDHGPDLIAIK